MIKKFRVYDKLAKQFIYPDKNYQGHFVLDLNGNFHNLQNGSGGDEYVVQQWAGWKDKNGVDIYEGDHVLIKIFGKSQIIFRNGAFILMPVGEEKFPNNILGYGAVGYYASGSYGGCQVIGNIFE